MRYDKNIGGEVPQTPSPSIPRPDGPERAMEILRQTLAVGENRHLELQRIRQAVHDFLAALEAGQRSASHVRLQIGSRKGQNAQRWVRHSEILEIASLVSEESFGDRYRFECDCRGPMARLDVFKRNEPTTHQEAQLEKTLQTATDDELIETWLERRHVPSELFPKLKQAFESLIRQALKKPLQGKHTARLASERAEASDVPELPKKAPKEKRWAWNKRDGETPPEFIQRMWGEHLGPSVPADRRLTKSKTAVLDRSLYDALRDHEAEFGLPEDLGFESPRVTTDEELRAFERGEPLLNPDDFHRLSSASRRKGVEK